jgi:hypothetical protein
MKDKFFIWTRVSSNIYKLYIYMYIYVCVCIYIYIYIYIYICTCVHVCVHVCLFVCNTPKSEQIQNLKTFRILNILIST